MDWQEFSTTWGFNYAFWAGMALTAALAYWTYSTLPKSRLAYHIRNSTVIDGASADFSSRITISYEGTEIPRATLSQVFMWNDGNQTLRRRDITPKSPLTLWVPGGQHILQVSVEAVGEHAMDITVEPGDEAAVDVTFEYVEPRQGFICSILHTGTLNDLKVDGVIVSAGSPVERPLPHEYLSNGWFAVVVIFGAALPLLSLQLARDHLPSGNVFLLIIAVTVILAIVWSFVLVEIASRSGHAKVKFGKPIT